MKKYPFIFADGLRKHVLLILVSALLCSCASGFLKEDSIMNCFPTSIDIQGWNMTSPPHEIPTESFLKGKNRFLSKEYTTDIIVSAEYERVDENAEILFEIWHTKSPLDAYTIAKRYSMAENMEYDKDADIYISDTVACFSKGNYFLLIEISSRYITSKGELSKAARFASERIQASGTIPRYASVFGRDIVFFRNPKDDFRGFHDFFEGTIALQGKEYHAAYFIRDTADSAESDFTEIQKKSTGAVITDFSDIRSFFTRSPSDRFFVYYLQRNIVVCVFDVTSINDGKDICRIIFQTIQDSFPPKRG
jgi:hypothetical protein